MLSQGFSFQGSVHYNVIEKGRLNMANPQVLASREITSNQNTVPSHQILNYLK